MRRRYLFFFVAFSSLDAQGPAQTYLENFTGYQKEGNWVRVYAGPSSLRFTFYRPDILRVDFLPDSTSIPDSSFVVIQDTSESVAFNVTDTPGTLEITSSGGGVSCQKNPLRLSYYNAANKLCLTEPSNGGSAVSGNSRIANFVAASDEHYYGTGERATALDKRGQAFDSYNTQTGGYGGPLPTMNVNIPIVLSSSGYAIYIDNTYPGHFDFASADPTRFSYTASGGELTYYLFTAPSMRDELASYTWLTGRQPLPPRWSLGYLQSKFGYQNEAEARSVVQTIRQKGFPADAIILDLYWYQNMGDLSWNYSAWNPIPMISDFLKTGIRTILITEPYFVNTSLHYAYADVNGFFAKNSGNLTYPLDNWWSCGCDAALLDITNSSACTWFWNLYQPLLWQGIGGFWTDLGEPERHPSGMIHALGTTARVHNIYDLLWAKMLFDGIAGASPGQRIFNLTRSGFAGIQRYGVFTWSGDVLSSFPALALQLPIMLGMGLSGLGYHHSDTGGFYGIPTPELYTRWMQFSTLSPVVRAHGANKPTEPWAYGPEAEAIAKAFISLRYELLPYLYTMAYQTYSTGVPIARPLLLDNPGDANLPNESSSYMLGDELLVSPVTTQGSTSQNVYLPQGDWYDFWTDNTYSGGQSYSFALTLERIPLFVAGGSILPMAPVMNYSGERPLDTLTLHLYPTAGSWKPFTLYEDDGATTKYATGEFATTLFSCTSTRLDTSADIRLTIGSTNGLYTGKLARRVYVIDIHHVAANPFSVRKNGQDLIEAQSYAELRGSPEGYWFDASKNNVLIQVSTSADSAYQVDCLARTTGIAPPEGRAPKAYSLAQNFPNPFNPLTTIRYEIPRAGNVLLRVYTTLGQHVVTLVNSNQSAGPHEAQFDGTGLASGTYIYRIQAGSFVATRKMIMLR